MQRNTIWFGSVLATGMVALGACIGTMDGEGETDPVGETVQLVSQRRDWLKNYDNRCDSCFKAFESCEKGAADELEEDACQVALDACVRGGLVDKGDREVADRDAEVVDEDAGIEDEDADVDEEEVDAGIDEDEDEVDEEDVDEEDAGVDEEDEEVDEVDAGIDQEDEEIDEDVDAGEEELEADAAKEQLIADIEACLDEARECVDADAAEAQLCVLQTVACVQAALESAFDVICAEQLQSVQAKEGKGARQAEEQLRGICGRNLEL